MVKKAYNEKQLFGHCITSPQPKHPHQGYWFEYKNKLREIYRQAFGAVICTCWAVETKDNPFDGHHRHYDNYGHEQLGDVVLLCRTCHDAITNRYRWTKYAHGHKDPDTLLCITERPQYEREAFKEGQKFVSLFAQTRNLPTNRHALVEPQQFKSAFTKTR